MLEFVVDYDLGATRAIILGRQGRYGEAVKQYLEEDQESEALNLTLEHIEDVMRDPDAFDAIVERFFWRNLSFGCRGWPEGAKIPSDEISVLLEGIRSPNMDNRDHKVLMVCGFPMEYRTGELADRWCSCLFLGSSCRI
jgi:hypothetical protein